LQSYLLRIADHNEAFNRAVEIARESKLMCVYLLRKAEHFGVRNRPDLRRQLSEPPEGEPIVRKTHMYNLIYVADFLFANFDESVRTHSIDPRQNDVTLFIN
jgi:hypothetical protein